MALQDQLVEDLLARVQKLESTQTKEHSHEDYERYLSALDRAALSMTVAIDVVTKILVEKNIVTKEELEKITNESRDKIVSEIIDKNKNPGT